MKRFWADLEIFDILWNLSQTMTNFFYSDEIVYPYCCRTIFKVKTIVLRLSP